MSRVSERIRGLSDMFSLDLLVRTLFSPFRQISAGQVTGPIGVQFRAFIDRLVSRFIGAMVRSFVLIAGCLAIGIGSLFGLILMVVWPLLPIMPVVGCVLAIVGWLPWR